MTDGQTTAIRALLNKTRNPHEIANQTGVKVGEVRKLMASEELTPLFGWGRESLQRYIVSRRRSTAPEWPPADTQRLLEARRLHDQGKLTMCQGRSGEWIIQYAIPSRTPVRRSPYFYGG